jgi:hypothetical protein
LPPAEPAAFAEDPGVENAAAQPVVPVTPSSPPEPDKAPVPEGVGAEKS